MEHTLAPWTGNLHALPGPPAAAAPTASHVRRWSLRIGRDGIVLSSTSERFSPLGETSVTRVRAQRSGPVVAMAVGGLALLLIGATAGRAWSPQPLRHEAAIVVPTAKPFVSLPTVTQPARGRLERTRPASPAAVPTAPDTTEAFGTASPLLDRKTAVERALTTGEFQEWAERDGVTGFAVAGPVEPDAAGSCRALAVLARKPDGTDAVSSSRVCQPANPATAPR